VASSPRGRDDGRPCAGAPLRAPPHGARHSGRFHETLHPWGIPLGSRRCPNPLCQEPHGQSAGDRCAWCRHNAQEPLHGIDATRLHNIALAVWQEASACVGGVA
jgi:hypothetical protein